MWCANVLFNFMLFRDDAKTPILWRISRPNSGANSRKLVWVFPKRKLRATLSDHELCKEREMPL